MSTEGEGKVIEYKPWSDIRIPTALSPAAMVALIGGSGASEPACFNLVARIDYILIRL
jgi:hypothetical protein